VTPSCPNPIDPAILAYYWLGILPSPDEAAVEEHLFACDPCGEALRGIIALVEGVRNLAREGSLRMVVSGAFLERATAQGLHIRQYAPPADGSVECTVTAEDDLLIAHLATDMRGARRVDLCWCDDRGVEQERLSDIPVNPDAGSILYQESITFAKASPTKRLILRMVSVDDSGTERLLAAFTFNHTRTLPG